MIMNIEQSPMKMNIFGVLVRGVSEVRARNLISEMVVNVYYSYWGINVKFCLN